MDYEVELKFRLDDPEALREWLRKLAAVPGDVVEQRDVYLAHPSRDFAATDEAFRIRSIGDDNRLTYKGPLVDQQTKTRQEVEVSFATGADNRSQMLLLLESLGFRAVRKVVKRRTPHHLDWDGRVVELAVDDVEGLGRFLELETLAAEPDWESARDSLLRLAEHLGLKQSERRSYLQLLLSEHP